MRRFMTQYAEFMGDALTFIFYLTAFTVMAFTYVAILLWAINWLIGTSV